MPLEPKMGSSSPVAPRPRSLPRDRRPRSATRHHRTVAFESRAEGSLWSSRRTGLALDQQREQHGRKPAVSASPPRKPRPRRSEGPRARPACRAHLAPDAPASGSPVFAKKGRWPWGGGGTQPMSTCRVDNLAEAVRLAAARDEAVSPVVERTSNATHRRVVCREPAGLARRIEGSLRAHRGDARASVSLHQSKPPAWPRRPGKRCLCLVLARRGGGPNPYESEATMPQEGAVRVGCPAPRLPIPESAFSGPVRDSKL